MSTDQATPGEHAAVARFRAELTARGGTGRIVVLPDSVHTAALAAEALGCEVGAIANSLLFDADGSPVLMLTSGAHRVDTAKVAARHRGPSDPGHPGFVRAAHRPGDRRGLADRATRRRCRPTSTPGCAVTTRCGPRPATPRRCSARRTTSWSR